MKKSKGKGKHGHRPAKSQYRRLRRKDEREMRLAALSFSRRGLYPSFAFT
ncbi:MAG TPA: hypothetical protein VG934_00225 [Candidatus Paceibacterota bacterium]|nr:hypothetical protein [Candidatus Paceibacterota bacterium]